MCDLDATPAQHRHQGKQLSMYLSIRLQQTVVLKSTDEGIHKCLICTGLCATVQLAVPSFTVPRKNTNNDHNFMTTTTTKNNKIISDNNTNRSTIIIVLTIMTTTVIPILMIIVPIIHVGMPARASRVTYIALPTTCMCRRCFSL